jgi:RNA polymerase sigma-54 factor
MTPSLQQAIKLLQMSKLELQEEIQQEMLENPVLEESQLEDAPGDRQEAEADAGKEDAQDPFDDIDYDSYFQDVDQGYVPPSTRDTGVELPSFENTLSRTPDLSDHLTWQLDMSVSEPEEKEIGRLIIGNLNDDGYLRASLEEIHQMSGREMSAVQKSLETIQGFDPVGVASRDLVECLCLQLKHLGQEGTAAETIVRHHLDKLQNRRYKELAEILEIDMEDLEAEIEIIKHLDPRPGQRYNNQSSNYVVPDVHVVKVGDEYQVLLNDEGLPRLRISPVYRRMAARGATAGGDAKEYVRNKLRSAFRLIKSIEERQRTILKVANSIVTFQRDFLDYGIERMRPLVLKDVADDIGMHESTVSRVVNNKYMHTHRGLFEMRFFFHSGIASTRGGADVSSLTVKEKIRKIIADEDNRRPFSDAAIVKVLKAEGLQIARRTVAKYREELKIPSSSNRKQAFPG